jgi:hypothetical protein
MNLQAQNSGPTLMTPEGFARLIARLSDILEQENKLLHENDPEGFKATLNEKTRLIATYNQQMSLVKKNPDAFKAFPRRKSTT